MPKVSREEPSSSSSSTSLAPLFYAIARECGKVRDDLPIWASKVPDPFRLEENDTHSARRRRYDVPNVPGAFQLFDVFSEEETKRIVSTLDELGFTDDAAVSLPRSIRHNSNLNWIVDDKTLDIVWDRCKDLFLQKNTNQDDTMVKSLPDMFGGKQPLGLNGRFRIYRYEEGDYFQIHTDGSWPGSRVSPDGSSVIQNAFDDRWSMYTILFFLTEDFDGGETEFLVNQFDPTKPARNLNEATRIGIRTPVGGALCFPHGEHPYHCLHSSATITRGVKYIIRSDVLFEL